MTTPVWVLLAFAAWTLATLLATIGVYRWSRILTGRAGLADFEANVPHGNDWYRRAMRAHANCIENLPVYGAIVVALQASGVGNGLIDACSIGVLIGRVAQTVTHVAFRPSNVVVGVRFTFFFLQLLCMMAIIALIVVAV